MSPSRLALASLLGVSLSTGCPAREQAEPPGDPPTSSEPTDASTCGPAGEHFASYGWAPHDARLLLAIRSDAPERHAALPHLRTLIEHAAATGLPIRIALSFDNASLQVDVLAATLARIGLAPAELVEVHSPTGEIAWLWSSSCAPELASARMLQHWGVMLRADLDARIGLGSPDRFPFDVLVLPDQRMALTTIGQGARVLAWLRSAGHGAPTPDAPQPGVILSELSPAPVRAVFQGEALLAVSEDAASPMPTASPDLVAPALPHVRTLRVTAEGVELDGSLWTPPAL